MSHFITILPVYNERQHITAVLDQVRGHSQHALVVDDGSTDGSCDVLRDYVERHEGIETVRHGTNQGYGAALRTGFEYAIARGYDIVVTIDCDGQHQPGRIPEFVTACASSDIVSGSRYLDTFEGDAEAPADRRRINHLVTEELNQRLGLQLTDAFCGFKAYRTAALSKLKLTDPGYAMPLELWVQAVHHGLKIVELPVPRIYLEEERSFGGALDDATTRLDFYHQVLDRSMEAVSPHAATSKDASTTTAANPTAAASTTAQSPTVRSSAVSGKACS
jgi:glycosyltransferase involved in cell wall biosynthesis